MTVTVEGGMEIASLLWERIISFQTASSVFVDLMHELIFRITFETAKVLTRSVVKKDFIKLRSVQKK